MKGKFIAGVQSAQTGDKLAPEQATEHSYGQKKVVRGWNPLAMVGGQATGRNNAMDMRMM